MSEEFLHFREPQIAVRHYHFQPRADHFCANGVAEQQENQLWKLHLSNHIKSHRCFHASRVMRRQLCHAIITSYFKCTMKGVMPTQDAGWMPGSPLQRRSILWHWTTQSLRCACSRDFYTPFHHLPCLTLSMQDTRNAAPLDDWN